MSDFRVILHGGDLSVMRDDQSLDGKGAAPILGFYTTRIVEAQNKAEAIEQAIKLTREEFALHGYEERNRSSGPVFELESIDKIGLWTYLFGKPRRGFTFYTSE